MSNVTQFPRRDMAYRYGLLRAVGTDGEAREELIQEGIRYVERRIEAGCLNWTEGVLRDMIERKRERLLREMEDLDHV